MKTNSEFGHRVHGARTQRAQSDAGCSEVFAPRRRLCFSDQPILSLPAILCITWLVNLVMLRGIWKWVLGCDFGELVDAGLAGGEQRGYHASALLGEHPAVCAGDFFEQFMRAQQCQAAGDRR